MHTWHPKPPPLEQSVCMYTAATTAPGSPAGRLIRRARNVSGRVRKALKSGGAKAGLLSAGRVVLLSPTPLQGSGIARRRVTMLHCNIQAHFSNGRRARMAARRRSGTQPVRVTTGKLV